MDGASLEVPRVLARAAADRVGCGMSGIRIEAHSTGRGLPLLARGTWDQPVLPLWHAITAFGNIRDEAIRLAPRDGVALTFRRVP